MRFKGSLKTAAAAVIPSAVALFCIISVCELDFDALELRSCVLYDKKDNVLAYTLSKDTQSIRFYTKKDEVSPLYLNMLISNEDKNFYSHAGVDFASLARAFFSNFSTGHITQGGSTIAMQVAKRLSSHKERSYLNKLKEVICAIYLTLFYGRDEVLSMYLTLAPFGSNIEGVKAASLKWFGHSAKELTPSEAALLTALPRAPEAIRPDRNLKRALLYKNKVLSLAVRNGLITDELAALSMKDEMGIRLYDIKSFYSPLLNHLISEFPDTKDFHTTLDPDVLEVLEQAAHRFELDKNDNATLSAVILDDKTHEVAGILPSSNLNRSKLCLPFSMRSPGSALKPFAYALAMNEGKLHPDTKLHDNSELFGIWQPQNFDRTFKGEISATNALSLSRNLPALEVTRLCGVNSLYSAINYLEDGALKAKNNTADLSLILGSADINLYNLTKLYAMLNLDGSYESFRLLENEDHNKSAAKRILSKDSARAAYNMLLHTPRPKGFSYLSDVSYKTGTSYRYTDALAIGSYGRYSGGVAIRFADNKTSSCRYTGFNNAAPALFEIFDALKHEKLVKEHLDSPLLRPLPYALKENIKNELTAADKDLLYIDFPKNNDIITPDHLMRVFVKYRGGKGRILLNVDGVQTEKSYFEVSKEGYYKVTVLDEYGHSDTVTFKVVFNPGY